MHFDVKAQDRCTLIEAQDPCTSVEAQIRAMLYCTRCTNIEEQDNCPAIDDQHQLGNGKTDIDMEIMTEQDSEIAVDLGSRIILCTFCIENITQRRGNVSSDQEK